MMNFQNPLIENGENIIFFSKVFFKVGMME